MIDFDDVFRKWEDDDRLMSSWGGLEEVDGFGQWSLKEGKSVATWMVEAWLGCRLPSKLEGDDGR